MIFQIPIQSKKLKIQKSHTFIQHERDLFPVSNQIDEYDPDQVANQGRHPRPDTGLDIVGILIMIRLR